MRFDSFISALDMGQCEDQMQRQALFDIALLFVVVDGVIDDKEVAFMKQWLDTIPWSSPVSQDEYYTNTLSKCKHAAANDDIDNFIRHRANQLVDSDMKRQALKLAEDIAHADGEIDNREKRALDFLVSLLG
jgi:tellurite resistance protein